MFCRPCNWKDCHKPKGAIFEKKIAPFGVLWLDKVPAEAKKVYRTALIPQASQYQSPGGKLKDSILF
jgi:hypothetical protein